MTSITQDLNKELTDLIGRWRGTRRSKREESLEEMVKIWITLSPSQKEDLMQRAIRASLLNREIEALHATQTRLLSRKQVNVKGSQDDI